MTLTVTALQAGFLNAWVDFNGAGDRADAQEQMFDSGPLAERADSLSVSVPEGTFVEGSTFARFGFSSAGTLFRDGLPDEGEVEDYRVAVLRLVLGNATRDNVPNVINVTFIAPYTVGLRELDANQLVCADTNDDGKVNIIGAMHVARSTRWTRQGPAVCSTSLSGRRHPTHSRTRRHSGVQ